MKIRCDICHVDLSSEAIMQDHMKGKRHKRMEMVLEEDKKRVKHQAYITWKKDVNGKVIQEFISGFGPTKSVFVNKEKQFGIAEFLDPTSCCVFLSNDKHKLPDGSEISVKPRACNKPDEPSTSHKRASTQGPSHNRAPSQPQPTTDEIPTKLSTRSASQELLPSKPQKKKRWNNEHKRRLKEQRKQQEEQTVQQQMTINNLQTSQQQKQLQQHTVPPVLQPPSAVQKNDNQTVSHPLHSKQPLQQWPPQRQSQQRFLFSQASPFLPPHSLAPTSSSLKQESIPINLQSLNKNFHHPQNASVPFISHHSQATGQSPWVPVHFSSYSFPSSQHPMRFPQILQQEGHQRNLQLQQNQQQISTLFSQLGEHLKQELPRQRVRPGSKLRKEFLKPEGSPKRKRSPRKKKMKPERERVEQEGKAQIGKIPLKHIVSRLLACKSVDNQMTMLVDMIKLTRQDEFVRKKTANLLSNHLMPLFGQEGTNIHIFGSSANGMGIKGCDLDLILSVDSSTEVKPLMRKVRKRLREGSPSMFTDIFSINSKRCPIIRFKWVPSDLKCDLSFNNGLALKNTEVLKFLGKVVKPFRPLCFVIRQWAKSVEVAGAVNAGPRLTHYALYMMVWFYLQQRLDLLSFEDLSRLGGKKEFINQWDCTFPFHSPHLFEPASPIPPLSQLLTGFFDFYMSMDLNDNVLSTRMGKLVPIKEFEMLPLFKKSVLMVQDPFLLEHNLTHNVSLKVFLKFHSALKDAFRICCDPSFKSVQRSKVDSKGNDLETTSSQVKDEPLWGIAHLLLQKPPNVGNTKSSKFRVFAIKIGKQFSVLAAGNGSGKNEKNGNPSLTSVTQASKRAGIPIEMETKNETFSDLSKNLGIPKMGNPNFAGIPVKMETESGISLSIDSNNVAISQMVQTLSQSLAREITSVIKKVLSDILLVDIKSSSSAPLKSQDFQPTLETNKKCQTNSLFRACTTTTTATTATTATAPAIISTTASVTAAATTTTTSATTTVATATSTTAPCVSNISSATTVSTDADDSKLKPLVAYFHKYRKKVNDVNTLLAYHLFGGNSNRPSSSEGLEGKGKGHDASCNLLEGVKIVDIQNLLCENVSSQPLEHSNDDSETFQAMGGSGDLSHKGHMDEESNDDDDDDDNDDDDGDEDMGVTQEYIEGDAEDDVVSDIDDDNDDVVSDKDDEENNIDDDDDDDNNVDIDDDDSVDDAGGNGDEDGGNGNEDGGNGDEDGGNGDEDCGNGDKDGGNIQIVEDTFEKKATIDSSAAVNDPITSDNKLLKGDKQNPKRSLNSTPATSDRLTSGHHPGETFLFECQSTRRTWLGRHKFRQYFPNVKEVIERETMMTKKMVEPLASEDVDKDQGDSADDSSDCIMPFKVKVIIRPQKVNSKMSNVALFHIFPDTNLPQSMSTDFNNMSNCFMNLMRSALSDRKE